MTKATRSLLVALVGLSPVLLGGASSISYYEEQLPTSMNPLFGRSMADYRSQELVFDRLFFRSAITNELQSRIVDSYTPSADRKQLTMVLKQGVKWHDGKPFGPDDVCFTVAALLDTKTPSSIAKPYREAISGCAADAKANSATVTFTKPYHNPREQLGFFVIPKHSFTSTTISPDLDFSSHPIGTGPMKGSKGRREVRFEAYPNAQHTPKIDVMSLAEGNDPFVAVRTLLNAGVQGLISVAPPLRPDVAASDDVALKSYDLRSWWFIAANTTKGPLKEKKVRQALNLTVDRSELREVTIGIDANDPNPPCEFVSGPFVQSSPYYNRQIKVAERSDRSAAATLMQEAGAKLSANRWMYQGQPVTLKIGMDAPLDAEAKDLLNQIGNQLQEGGFDRAVYKITADDWNRKAVTGQMADFDLLIGKWSFGLVEDVDPFFHTRSESRGNENIFNYSNADVDKLLDQYEDAKTDTEARDAYHALHQYLADDLPYLFLWKLDTKSAWRNEVRNNTIAPYYYFTEFDGWKFEEGAAGASSGGGTGG